MDRNVTKYFRYNDNVILICDSLRFTCDVWLNGEAFMHNHIGMNEDTLADSLDKL